MTSDARDGRALEESADRGSHRAHAADGAHARSLHACSAAVSYVVCAGVGVLQGRVYAGLRRSAMPTASVALEILWLLCAIAWFVLYLLKLDGEE